MPGEGLGRQHVRQRGPEQRTVLDSLCRNREGLAMNRLGSISLISNLKSLLIVALSVVSTWLCRRYGIEADFPLALVTMAVVFPIVFSIGGAYKRREAALDD
jgi:hypothetical protein